MCEIFCKSFWIMYDGSLVNWRPGTWLLILANSFLMQAFGKSLCEFTLQCRWWAPQPELRSRCCLAAREHVAGGSSGGVLRERARSCFGCRANPVLPAPAERARCRSGCWAHDFGADLFVRPLGLHLLVVAFVPCTFWGLKLCKGGTSLQLQQGVLTTACLAAIILFCSLLFLWDDFKLCRVTRWWKVVYACMTRHLWRV